MGFVRYTKGIKLINLFLSTRYQSKTNAIIIRNYAIAILGLFADLPFYRNVCFFFQLVIVVGYSFFVFFLFFFLLVWRVVVYLLGKAQRIFRVCSNVILCRL